MSWSAYITGEGGLIAQYDKIACGGIFGQNGSTFAQAQECRLAFFFETKVTRRFQINKG